MSSADELSSGESPTKASDNGMENSEGKEVFESLAKGDLSDVSDLESHDGLQEPAAVASPHKTMQDQLETELDFEAEEKDEEPRAGGSSGERSSETDREAKSEGEVRDADNDLEEGECTDAEDARPEEESKPICRFYNRGQCTWGANCRFVHPGVTDKGNYTMFDMVRPLVPTNGPPGSDTFFDKPFGSFGAADVEGPPVESAWERGLRHAKEMMKKATRRKETDMDFEEKKMNLGLGQEDLDKENDFYTRPASPIYRYEDPVDRYGNPASRRYSRENPEHFEGLQSSSSRAQLDSYYRQRQHRLSGDADRFREHSRSPISPPTRSHHGASKHRERDDKGDRSRSQQKSRPDDWSDPWMRQKSPTRKTNWKRSHSSDSSVSSSSGSSDSGSSSSSDSRYSGNHQKSKKGKYEGRSAKYEKPAPPKPREVAAPKRRSPPVESKRISVKEKPRRPARASSVSSDDSKSSFSSSSDDGKPSARDKSTDYSVTKIKAMDAMKLSGQKQQIKLTLRECDAPPKPDGGSKKKPAQVASADAKAGAKKSVSRREELLKQLKAVEDAIRRKKSKPT